jgi:hypothetical protein
MRLALLAFLLLSPLVFAETDDASGGDSEFVSSQVSSADPNFWMRKTGIVSLAVLGTVVLLTLVGLLLYFQRKRKQQSEESMRWRDPLWSSIEGDLIES